ncbi:hypothetical protein V6N13_103009 [Hibiscus sabdariffa]
MMATRRISLRKLTIRAPIAMAAGPTINFKSIPYAFKGIPLASTLSCMAMNIPASHIPLTAYGMLLKFIVGPAAMAIGALIVGLRGDVLRVAT